MLLGTYHVRKRYEPYREHAGGTSELHRGEDEVLLHVSWYVWGHREYLASE
jgi:hypothetical protein